MKTRLIVSLITLTAAIGFSLPAMAQAPQPQQATWVVQAQGCPAASALPATLAAQWTTALAAVNGNATETALVNAAQIYVSARVANYAASNPQQNIIINVGRPAMLSGLQFQINISIGVLPIGSTCPTS